MSNYPMAKKSKLVAGKKAGGKPVLGKNLIGASKPARMKGSN